MRGVGVVAAVVVVAGVAGACFVRPAASVSTSTSTSDCAGCHAAIAEEWGRSFHRTAFIDETFQASLALEESKEHAFCTRCHAPAAARAGTAVGVDCAACHGEDPHAAPARAAVRAKTSTCGPCHEFTFDDGRPELVQKTLSEHAASAFATVACADCHMSSRDGHPDHRFLSGHAPARIAGAVHVEVARDASSSLRVKIKVDAGHAFPTGDMFRRARLIAFAEGSRGQIVADAERSFGRTWGAIRGGHAQGRRTEESDTRIHGAWEEVVAFDEPSAPITRVRWQLVYERVIAVRGPHVSLASSDVIAEGELDWPTTTPAATSKNQVWSRSAP